MRRRKVYELDSLFPVHTLQLAPLLALVSELARNLVDNGKGGDWKGVEDREDGVILSGFHVVVGEILAVSLLENVVVGGFVGLWKE